MIDGSECYVPIKAETNDEKVYIILNDPEYNDLGEFSVLFEFYPGDKVSVNNDNFPLGDFQYAGPLLKEGDFPKRKYFEFMYKATLNKIGIDKNIYEKYRDEIAQIRQELEEGKKFYKNIVTTIEFLEKYNQNVGSR